MQSMHWNRIRLQWRNFGGSSQRLAPGRESFEQAFAKRLRHRIARRHRQAIVRNAADLSVQIPRGNRIFRRKYRDIFETCSARNEANGIALWLSRAEAREFHLRILSP